MKKLIVVAHGIGNHKEDFHKAWEKILRKNHGDLDFEVKGLWWDDVLDKIADKYPLFSEKFAEAAAKFGLDELKKKLGEEDFQLVQKHVMDLLVYCGLEEMRNYVQTCCSLRLARMTENRAKHTILIGHSLGAAMLPHIVQLERRETGSIPYGGMILLASPLGMESPIPSLIPDPLSITPTVRGNNGRTEVLKEISYYWNKTGDDRLYFLINENDPVCSDVQVKVGTVTRDLIPVRQSFSDREIKSIERYNPNAVKKFKAGSAQIKKLVDNHAFEKYLGHKKFQEVFRALVK